MIHLNNELIKKMNKSAFAEKGDLMKISRQNSAKKTN